DRNRSGLPMKSLNHRRGAGSRPAPPALAGVQVGRAAQLLALALLSAIPTLAQMSVSGNLPVTTLDTAPAAASITEVNGAATVTLAGQTSAAVTLTGTWTATLTPELSFDGGSTWVATSFYQPNLGQIITTATANGSYTTLTSGGESHARVRASAFTS